MDASDGLLRLGLLAALMAALALVEARVPLFPRKDTGTRLPANLGLTVLYFALNLLLNATVLGLVLYAESQRFGLLHWLGLPALVSAVIAFIALDGFAYQVHALMHRMPWLWRFHRIHHSDRMVDVSTAFRQHPGEGLLRFVFALGPALLLGASPEVVALYRLVSGANALFEHANLRVPAALDRLLVRFWVTPDMHKVHHSRWQPETDSNYGNLFSWYDRAFGTYTPSARAHSVRYGLDGHDQPEQHRLGSLLALPWRDRLPDGPQQSVT